MTDAAVKTEEPCAPTPLTPEAVELARQHLVRADRRIDALYGYHRGEDSTQQERALPDGDVFHTLDIDSEDWEQAPMSDGADDSALEQGVAPDDGMRTKEEEEQEEEDEDETLVVDVAAARWRRRTREFRVQQMRERVAEGALPFPERTALLRDAEDMGSYARLRAAHAPAGTRAHGHRSALDRAPRLAPRDQRFLLRGAFCPELTNAMSVVPDIARAPCARTPAAPVHVRPGSDVRYAALLRQSVARVLARPSAGGFVRASTQAMDVLCDVVGGFLTRVCRAVRVRLDNMEQPAVPSCALVHTSEGHGPVLACGSPYMVLNRALLDIGLQGFFTVMNHLATNPDCVSDESSNSALAETASDEHSHGEITATDEATGKSETSESVVKKEEETSNEPKASSSSDSPHTAVPDEADSGAMVDGEKGSVEKSGKETNAPPEPEGEHGANAESTAPEPVVEEQEKAHEEEQPNGDDAMKDDNEPKAVEEQTPANDMEDSTSEKGAELPHTTETEQESHPDAKETTEEPAETKQEEPAEQSPEPQAPEQKGVEEPVDEIEEVESPPEKDAEPSRQTGPVTRRRTRGLAKKQEPPPAEEEALGAEEESHARNTRRRNARPAVKRQAPPSTMALRKNSPTRKRR